MLHQSRSGRVLTLRMDDPSGVNTITPELAKELVEAITEATDDSNVGAIVLTGSGSTFSAGGNVKQMASRPKEGGATKAPRARSDESLREVLMATTDACLKLADSPKPTIAAVNGACAGGGLSLAAACDIRIAGDSAKFAFAYSQIGLGGDLAAAWSLTRILGPARARAFCLVAPRLDAAAALDIGLISAVHPDPELAEESAKLAAKIAAMSPIALAHIKTNLDAAATLDRAEAVMIEAENFIVARASADHREAIRAFVEKRPPIFVGAQRLRRPVRKSGRRKADARQRR